MKKVTFVSIMSAIAVTLVFAVPVQSQGSVEELMASGSALLKNGAYTEAIGTFRKVVAKEPRNFEAQYNLAFAYMQAERYDKAVAEFKKALSLDSRNSECWANIGFAYERLGKTSSAADAIARSVELNPNNVEARLNLAGMYENANAFDKAIAQYEAAIRTDGSRGDAYCGVARCMTNKGNFAGAKKYLTEAIGKQENNAEAHWLLGNIAWKKENKQADALKEYEISVKLDPNSQVFYENLAKLQEEMGKKDDALATWKKYLIYLNEALKKEEVQSHIDKLERGESTVNSAKADSKAAREQSSQENAARMQELKNELRKDNKPEAKRIESQPVDIGSDLNKKDTTAALDLRKEAKKKAEAKKEAP
jgi:tetratricopeptide (TPR) repeat protein